MKIMKKICSLFLCLALVLGMIGYMPVTAEAMELSTGSCGSGVVYSFDSGTGTLTIKGKGTMKDYGPNQDKSPFSGRDEIRSVVIGDGVTSVGQWAFYDCFELQSVELGKNMKTVSDYAFYGCVGLADVAMQPDSVTYIGLAAFAHCQAMEVIHLPDSVATIKYQAFDDTGYYLDKSNWQDKVLYIGHCLYSGIYNTVYTSNNKGDKKKPYNSGTYIQTTRDGKVIGKYTVKEGTTLIADGAFKYTSLSAITLPDSITTIGSSAFLGCNGLRKITLSKNLTEIGEKAFYSCVSLKEITIPKRVVVIEDETFGKSGLKSVTIPKTVRAVGNGAFSNCSSLTKVTIKSGVRAIGEEAFDRCGYLKSVTVPKSVTTIGRHAFGYEGESVIKGFKLKGYKGSAAQKYAKNNKIKFSVISKK